MVRTQVQLDEDQYEELKLLAAKRSKSISQLVREGVEHVLTAAHRREVWGRLVEAAGTCHDPEGKKDVATRHDDYLAEIYRK